jgi:5-methyltetrahydropteroyltriglutamate--homocysteine methyltransferase
MSLIHKLLPTTVVGSYPVVKSPSLRSLLDPLHSAVETAVSDQLAAGIDIISDGQVRGDMIEVFARALPGIRDRRVVSTVMPAAKPITVADTAYARSRHRFVKGILTGPTTLAHGLQVATPSYRDRADLALDLAQALAVEAKALQEAGITLLQIDEPIFSTGTADMEAGKRAIEVMSSVVQVPLCLHVCGTLADIIDDLLHMPVAVLDFEFSGTSYNLEVLSRKDLGEKLIGFGCIDSSDPAVEKVSVVKKRIQAGLEVFDPERILIDPDCGLRMLSREAAFGKLKAMVEATREIRVEFPSSTSPAGSSKAPGLWR